MPLCFRLSTFNYWILGNAPLVLSFSFSCLFVSLLNHLWSVAALLHHCFFSCFLTSSFLSGFHPWVLVLHCGGATCVCRSVVVMVVGLWLHPPSLRSAQPLISSPLLYFHR